VVTVLGVEDPSDPNYIYAESQGGEIGRINRHTWTAAASKPFPQYNERTALQLNTPHVDVPLMGLNGMACSS